MKFLQNIIKLKGRVNPKPTPLRTPLVHSAFTKVLHRWEIIESIIIKSKCKNKEEFPS